MEFGKDIVNLPDFYKSEKDLYDDKFKQVNTNDRYPIFKQRFKTVGDEEQFYSFLSKQIDNRGHIRTGGSDGYTFQDVHNTFQYLFHKFKKGIFVRIKENRVETFLPFCKINFVNEYNQLYKTDPEEFKTFDDMFDHVSKRLGIKHKQQTNPSVFWYANNGIFRYEVSRFEIDPCTNVIHDMLVEVCNQRTVNDCEFFVNRRDFPLLKKNRTEPYDDIWGKDKPLVSHKYKRYVPILSMSSTDDFADIMIPTWEDWSRSSTMEENKLFPFSYNKEFNKDIEFNHEWDKKIDTAIFRGSSTGVGYNEETNQRLRLVQIDSEQEDQEKPLLDAGITKWNIRPRKHMDDEYVRVISSSIVEKYGTKGFKNYQEQSDYKYIVNIQGHAAAFRMGQLFRTKSVVLDVKSEYKLWYSNKLVPYEHYVPVKADMSDLLEKIEWCRDNDDKCKKIVENAFQFYNEHLTTEKQMDYLGGILNSISHLTGNVWYPKKSQLEYQIMWEKSMINRIDSFEYEVLEEIYSSKKTDILKVKSGKKTLMVKRPSNNEMKEVIHESFIYNNGLKRVQCPNFRRVHGVFEKDGKECVLLDYIEGETLFKYLSDKSRPLVLTEFCVIMMQISLAYQIAYETCNFIHYDANPWNIVLYKYKNHKKVTYKTKDKVYSIYTNIIPIIVDYGKSYIITQEGTEHGYVKTHTKHSQVRDMYMITINALYLILSNKHLDGYNMRKITDIYNIFFPRMRTSLSYIKRVLYGIKKYDILVSIDPNKYIENNKFEGIMDFFNMYSKISKFTYLTSDNTENRVIYEGKCQKNGEWFISDPKKSRDIILKNMMYKGLLDIIESDHLSVPIYNLE